MLSFTAGPPLETFTVSWNVPLTMDETSGCSRSALGGCSRSALGTTPPPAQSAHLLRRSPCSHTCHHNNHSIDQIRSHVSRVTTNTAWHARKQEGERCFDTTTLRFVGHVSRVTTNCKMGCEEEGSGSNRPELVAFFLALRDTLIEEPLLYLCDNQSLLKAVNRWIGEGGKATLVGRFEKTREFQTQPLHYFSKSDNKSNHHHYA